MTVRETKERPIVVGGPCLHSAKPDFSVWILVDYSNVDPLLKQRGLGAVAWEIIQAIGPANFTPAEQVQVRLYGGWYQGDEFSKLAQQLAAEISGAFPQPVYLPAGDESLPLRVNVELARSLLIDPSRDLFHTYRPRGLPGGIICESPPFPGCISPALCPIQPLFSFFTDRTCPATDCGVRPRHVLSRPEQKLVDTMLVADLIHLASQRETVGVVSSDDDIWPGIRMALSGGGSVIHIHSKKGQGTPEFYKGPLPSAYQELHLQG